MSRRQRRRRNKRRKSSEEEDYISRLPDSIIIDEILSRLSTKEAVKTGVLSTRWKYLWTCNPTLDFPLFDIRDNKGFVSIVNKTLALYIIPLTRNTCFPYDEDRIRYQIPQDLYAHSSLTELTTNFCDYAPKAEVSWTSLKELYIGSAALTEDALQRILAGTPLLEHLELDECWGTSSIQVSSTSALKELVITEWLDPRCLTEDTLNLNTLEISIPSVKSLELLGAWQTKCLLLDASSLVEAHLTEFSEFSLVYEEGDIQEYAAMVKEMLLRVTSVSELSVGPIFLRFDEGNLIKEEDYWSSLEHLPFMKLKVISIWLGSFDPRKDCFDYLLGFAQFMLRKATVIEKMIISPKSYRRKLLTTLRRCSPKTKAEIICHR
ncbi:hypothetical protein COLO4_31579 [Corchorus olitorius]|uniref:F-box domain-containing protein n=1 Tax=Corchorus olitorius TaxID=93759 RepID=A0A1R3H437_9ROSI|nr:hypothetical protein COLO4_31579 [Corchorus olitorius]